MGRHADVVDETTDGTGRVDGLTLAQVRALDAGSSFARAFAGQRVPTFEEAARFVAERPGLELLVELKGVWSTDDAALVTGVVDAAGIGERVVVQSFWPPTVAALRAAAPRLVAARLRARLPSCGVPGARARGQSRWPPPVAARRDAAPHLDRALLLALHPDSLGELVAVCADLGVVGCHPEVALLAHEPGIVETLRDAGLRVHVWTADTPDEWDDLLVQGWL